MSGVSSFRSTLVRAAVSALAGLLSAYTALAVAGLVRPATGPVTVVGGAVIDRTPAPVKDFAIRTFGENDKTALQLGILALLG
ncbi:molybdopterin-binding oxidoreductase, partial [Streptomyces hydrogenans]